MTIYADGRIPYFYIIQHKESGIKYAGAKWGIDANPDTFMLDTREGYTTSSSTINDVLRDNAGVMYSVLEIILESDLQIPFGCLKIEDYENWFFNENDCRKSKEWSNKFPTQLKSHDSIECKTNMMKTYGVENCSALSWVRDKAAETLFKATGYHYAMQDPTKLAQSKSTRFDRTGYEHALQDPVSMDKFKSTNILKLGVEFPMQSPTIRYKSAQTFEKNYGIGITNPMQVKEIRDKSQSAQKKLYMEEYGVDNQFSIGWYCTECDKSGKSIGNLGRWHKGHIGLFVCKHGVLTEYLKC